jgi:hypothetical protein
VVILILLSGGLFLYAFILIVKAVYKLLKAVFYLKFANKKQIDEGYKKHVVKTSEDYKEFESKFNNRIDNLINPKSFEL